MKEERPSFTSRPTTDETTQQCLVRRRSFLKNISASGAALSAATLLTTSMRADDDRITRGDIAILRFLAAAELIEADLWQQYNELGGIDGGNPAYIAALQNLDGDTPQYIADNTDDELSHAAFLNAYLVSKGAEPVNLDRFRTLPGSQAAGAKTTGRLTNLLNLNVDTSWYTRYRSNQNPDFNTIFRQAVNIQNQPAVPLNDILKLRRT